MKLKILYGLQKEIFHYLGSIMWYLWWYVILKLNHFVLQFLFFDVALKIMLLFDEIWDKGQIKNQNLGM